MMKTAERQSAAQTPPPMAWVDTVVDDRATDADTRLSESEAAHLRQRALDVAVTTNGPTFRARLASQLEAVATAFNGRVGQRVLTAIVDGEHVLVLRHDPTAAHVAMALDLRSGPQGYAAVTVTVRDAAAREQACPFRFVQDDGVLRVVRDGVPTGADDLVRLEVEPWLRALPSR